MKRYPKYKDSGAPWLRQLPAHWEVGKLSRFASEAGVKNAGMVERNLLSLSYGRIVRKDIEANEGLLPASFEGYQIVERGDTVLRLTDLQNDQRSLRAGYVDERGIITSAYSNVRPVAVTGRWLFNALRASDLLKVFYSMGGGVRQSLDYDAIKRVPIPVPPESEQLAIDSYLVAEEQRIVSAISSQERMVDLLKERIDSLVLKSISEKHVQHIRIGHITEIVSRPIGESPSRSYTRLGLFNRGRGLFHKDDSNFDEMGDSEFFYVRPGDLIISGQFAWEGAVAMAGAAEDGCVVSHRYPILRGLDGVVKTEYLLAFFCTELGTFLLNEHSRGAAGRNRPLNIRSLLKEKIPLPSIELQMHVVEAIKQRQSILDKIAQLNRLLKERRSAIVTNAVTGQIDVR